jgi:phage-related minor tail protein
LTILVEQNEIEHRVQFIVFCADNEQARAKAEKATAEAETVRIDNTEHATRILIENIVEPLKEELNENRKALQATRREMARLRKAIDTANSCRHHDDCPVLYGMREYSKEQDGGEPEQQPVVKRRQRVKREAGVVDGGDSEIGGEPDDPSGQPP